MGMTITEKILARASGRNKVKPGDIVNAKIDVAMANDPLGAYFYPDFRDLAIPVWDTDKIAIVIDHASPPSVLGHTEWVADALRFVEDYGIKHFYNMQGVAHQILPESGYIKPGSVNVGTDSHTCTYGGLGAFSTGIGSTEMCWVFATGELWFRVPETIRLEITGQLPEMVMAKDVILKVLGMVGANGATYKTMEFGGETITNLSIDGRLTICNMAVEAGAKNGIIEPDQKTLDYLKGRTDEDVDLLSSDKDSKYFRTIPLNVEDLVPQVACPHSPANVVPVTEVRGRKVQQVLIGTCTGGRMEDFRAAAGIIKGKRIPRDVRCLVYPASAQIYRDMLKEGLMSVFAEAGCVICNSQCGPCGGLHMGLIARGETCLGTHNRNFKGRMGSPEGEIFLASPVVAAATAVTGRITDPREL